MSERCFNPLIILEFCWTCSCWPMSVSCWGAQNWTCCWQTSSLSSRTSGFSTAELLSSQLTPLDWWMKFFFPRCRTWCSPLNSVWFLLGSPAVLLWMATCLHTTSTPPPDFCIIFRLDVMNCPAVSSVKQLSRLGPRINTWVYHYWLALNLDFAQ